MFTLTFNGRPTTPKAGLSGSKVRDTAIFGLRVMGEGDRFVRSPRV